MPSFSDSIVLFLLALLLFGPKQLPKLARELGKWVGEFRRASNDFKMQMEDELRASEQEERRKQVDAMQAAAPVAPALPVATTTEGDTATAHASLTAALEQSEPIPAQSEPMPAHNEPAAAHHEMTFEPPFAATHSAVEPLPIATSGELKIMPPATGLPTPRSTPAAENNGSVGELLGSIPVASESAKETVTHGD